MAIARKSLNKQKVAEFEELDPIGEQADSFEEPAPASSARVGEASSEPAPEQRFRLLRGTLGRLRRGAQEQEELEVKPQQLPYPPALRPSDLEKMGYISPLYTLSRSVQLNPRVLEANRCIGLQADTLEAEFYRQLRTRILQRTQGDKGATIMVTSALHGEGKTLTAINLAFTFAKEFRQTALLVDCDLRQQQVHKILGFPSDRGLVDYLMDDCPVMELFVWPGVDKLTVISGGKTVKESCELLGSPGMKDLVEDMKNRYPERYVIFDAPPILSSADAIAFSPFVDFVLVVTETGRTSLKDLNRALELLPREKVLGLVMNRH